eukprot:scaffold2405_cov37-Prasinocladus_malaysianus.AAC.1
MESNGATYLLPREKTRRRRACEVCRRMGLRVCLGATFVILLVAWMSCLVDKDPVQRSVHDVC